LPILKKWYKHKKPTLQIRILKEIALEGESSKIGLQKILETYYPDISDAVEILKKLEIIEKSRVDRKSRRPEQYYKLTKTGLEAVLDEFSDAEIFWRAMISYCELSKHPINREEFDNYYKSFEANYLGYHQSYDILFQFNFVNKLFEKWFPEYSDFEYIVPITISQKVLECIALHRSVTLEQIIDSLHSQKTKFDDVRLKEYRNEVGDKNAEFVELPLGYPDLLEDEQLKWYRENELSKENIMRVIDRHSLSSNYSFGRFSKTSEDIEFKKYYAEFTSHLLIRVIEDESGKRYELTLFGVILILTIVYYKCTYDHIYFNDYLNRLGQRDPNIENYYNTVITNYQDKIPLIFGKWQILVNVFDTVDLLAPYFEPIFNEAVQKPLVSLSVNIGGVKELYENMREISYHRFSKLTQIYESGQDSLEMSRKGDANRMSFIKEKLSEIWLLLVGSDLTRLMKHTGQQQNFRSINQASIVTTLEKSFANELTFLFYIFLTRKVQNPPESEVERTPSMLYDYMEGIGYTYGQERIGTPRDLLLNILRHDIEIKNKVMSWVEDSVSYERQTIDNMLILKSEIDSDRAKK
jgi:DNA-binding PadR family transcriptional regulator